MVATRNTLVAICLGLMTAFIVQMSKQHKKIKTLREEIKQCKERLETTQELYDMQRDEVLRLEEENQILGSYAAQKDTLQ